MSSVDVTMPCAGDSFVATHPMRIVIDCIDCAHYEIYGGKCLGMWGWAFMALAAAEVARERGDNAQR